MSRCKSCNLRLESFDDDEMCKKCIRISTDDSVQYKDPQHLLITNVKSGCVITPIRGGKE